MSTDVEEPELEWPEELEESHPEYARLSEALDELKESIVSIITAGLMTDSLRGKLKTLAESAKGILDEDL